MSFVPVVRTTYQLVCDGCGFERYPVYVDDQEDDIAAAIDFDGWNDVDGGIYCGRCSWHCRCGKAFRGSPPLAEMCAECERNRYGRLIDVTPDWERCPGSGVALPGKRGKGTSVRCQNCPARVPGVGPASQLTMDDHLRLRMFNPITFEVGTRIRDLWTNEVFEVAKHNSRTGVTELTAVATGEPARSRSNNNARYVAVREGA